MVARVRRVDGDERQVPQILPALEVGLLGGRGFGERGLGKDIGDAMGMHGDQAGQLLGGGVAEPLGDARGLHAHAGGAGQLETDQLAVLRFVGLPARHRPFLQLLAIDRIDDAGAARERAENAEQLASRAGEPLDGPRLIGIAGIGAERGDARKHAIADAGDRTRFALALGHQDAGRRPVLLVPGRGPRDELAVGVARDDLDHRDGRERARPHQLAA